MPGGPSMNYLTGIPRNVLNELQRQWYKVTDSKGKVLRTDYVPDGIRIVEPQRNVHIGTLWYQDQGTYLAWKLQVFEKKNEPELTDVIAKILKNNQQHLQRVLVV